MENPPVKPPSKEEVIFEWFLGDSKEIVAELKTTLAEAATVRDAIVTGKSELAATVDAATRELVTAHRELAKAISDAKADHGKAGGTLTASVHRALADGARRLVVVATICAGVGALVGAGAALAAFRLIGQ
jgi:hypothetical protein